jgi:hypothetical protein
MPALWLVIPVTRDDTGVFEWRFGGTAFAVTEAGLLFTAAHVTYVNLEHRTRAQWLFVARPETDFPDRRFLLREMRGSQIVAQDDLADIAVLQVDGLQDRVPHARLTFESPPVGRSCATLGYSAVGGDPNTGIVAYARAAAGIVSTTPYPFSNNGAEFRENQEVDMIVHPGASGGPAFLSNGEVFGVVRGNLTHAGGQEIRIENLTSVSSVRSFTELLGNDGARLQTLHRRRWWRR